LISHNVLLARWNKELTAMPVQFPLYQLPAVLDECGPAEDPTILLTGIVRIGDSAIRLVAVRIDTTLRSAPDFKSGVDQSRYQENGLEDVLEATLEEMEFVASEFSELLGESGPSIVQLPDGAYRLWLISGSP
jgi:hypothetical protein